MGQSNSHIKSTTSAAGDPNPNYTLNGPDVKSNLGNNNEDTGETLTCCCVIKTNKKNFSNSKWKRQMTEQLENLELGVWPKLLCKSLKNFSMGDDGRVYQADVFWAYKNYSTMGNKSFSVQSVLSQSKEDVSFVDSVPLKEINGEKSNVSERKVDENVQGLLDNSHIFDEKFYQDNQKDTWMNKSYDLKRNQSNNLNDSFHGLTPQRTSTKTQNNTLPEVFLRSGNRTSSQYTVKHIEKYKNNTFVNQLMPVRTESDESNDLLASIMRYKTVTDIIEKHTKQKRNVFYQLIYRFSAYFIETYGVYSDHAKKNEMSRSQAKLILFRATTDLQQFIRIIFEGLCTFYRLDSLDTDSTIGREALFSRDNLLSFTTSLVFTKEIYDILFELFKMEESDQEVSFQKNVKYCRKLNPQDFGVPDEYCCNERTINYFFDKGLLERPSTTQSHQHELLQEDKKSIAFNISLSEAAEETEKEKEEEEEKIKDQNPQDSSKIPSTNLEEKQEKSQKLEEVYKAVAKEVPPYDEAISMLASLKHRKSPIHKLKTTVKVAELITKFIEKFYARFGLINANKLDADQTLSIFLYIVAKSGICDLTAHCRVIEKFSTNNILNSVSGYYATTLEACVNCICSMNFSEQDRASVTNRLSTGFKEFVTSLRFGGSVEKFSLLQRDSLGV